MNNNPLPDRTVLLALVATLLLVFSLVFSMRPQNQPNGPSIQWRELPQESSRALQI